MQQETLRLQGFDHFNSRHFHYISWFLYIVFNWLIRAFSQIIPISRTLLPLILFLLVEAYSDEIR